MSETGHDDRKIASKCFRPDLLREIAFCVRALRPPAKLIQPPGTPIHQCAFNRLCFLADSKVLNGKARFRMTLVCPEANSGIEELVDEFAQCWLLQRLRTG